MGEQDEMEKAAKQWQVADIQKDLKALDGKMDQLLVASKSYVTNQQLKDSEVAQQKLVNDSLTVIRTKYDPIYRMFWALMTGVVIETAVLVLQFTWRR